MFVNVIIGVILYCWCYHLWYHVDNVIALLFLCCKRYGFGRVPFTLRCFLLYTPCPHLEHEPPQSTFIKSSLGASSSTLMIVELHVVVRNTVLVQLLVWITQQSTNLMFRIIFILNISNMIINYLRWKVYSSIITI